MSFALQFDRTLVSVEGQAQNVPACERLIAGDLRKCGDTGGVASTRGSGVRCVGRPTQWPAKIE